MDNEITLDELVGEHILTGVDESERTIEHWGSLGDCQCINFVLDGITYTAVEDPDDGYRSALDKILVSNEKVSNTFAPVRVFAKKRTVGRYGYEDDVLEFLDIANGKIILEIGTESIDDYYPGFVASWQPENMSVNEDQ